MPKQTNHIRWPKSLSEFEVQSELYQRLKAEFPTRGCVSARCKDGDKAHKVYLDIVVYNDQHEPAVIVEVKNYGRPQGNRNLGNRQARRYSKFGVPVLACFGIEDIFRIMAEVRAMSPPF